MLRRPVDAEIHYPHISSMEQKADSPSAAVTDGYEKGRAGEPQTANPRLADRADAKQWSAGWDQGSEKRAVVTAKPDPETPANG